MSRLFAFGCSFTNYRWPTWADILGREFSYYENWGKCGAGNHFIFNSLNECILRNNITHTDTVIIMWTNISREDRYINNTWQSSGNIYTQKYYDQQFIEKYVDEKGYLIRDLAFIHSAKKLLEHIGCNHIFLSMVPITNFNQYIPKNLSDVDDVVNLYKDVIDFIRPSVYEEIFQFDWHSRPFKFNEDKYNLLSEEKYNLMSGREWPSFNDFLNKNFKNIKKSIIKELTTFYDLCFNKRHNFHPTPMEHLDYVRSTMSEFIITKSTVDWVSEIDHKVRTQISYDWRHENINDLSITRF
jgi:hypothetical protein